MDLALTDSSIPDNLYAEAALNSTFTLPGSPYGRLVTAFGLNWNPIGGGDPQQAEGSLSSENGGGSEFFYYDDTQPFLMQSGIINASLFTDIVGPGDRTNIGLTETLLDLTPVPEPAYWPTIIGLLLVLGWGAYARRHRAEPAIVRHKDQMG